MPALSFGFAKFVCLRIFLTCIGLMLTLPVNSTSLGAATFFDDFLHADFAEIPSASNIKIFARSPIKLPLEVLGQSSLQEPLQLTIYIEGDGAAWYSRQIPPSDPTPKNPIAAYLALADPHFFVAYLARPCMYLQSEQLKQCSAELWSDARFGIEALALSNQAIDDLIAHIKERGLLDSPRQYSLNLVGYSGGGVLAALMAAQRRDVACLVTLASPLDIEVWAKLQKVAPLAKSFNPAYPDANLSQIRQMHWFGAEDRVVPPQAIGRYRNWNPSIEREQVIQILPNFNHRNYWIQDWPSLKDKSCLN
jgi:pimeloyl-ACP methyl ester carboxylesterase